MKLLSIFPLLALCGYVAAEYNDILSIIAATPPCAVSRKLAVNNSWVHLIQSVDNMRIAASDWFEMLPHDRARICRLHL